MCVCVDRALAACQRGFQRALHFTLKLIAACHRCSCQLRSFPSCSSLSLTKLSELLMSLFSDCADACYSLSLQTAHHSHSGSLLFVGPTINKTGGSWQMLVNASRPRGLLLMSTLLLWRSCLRTERLQLIPLSRDETENKYLGLEDSPVTNWCCLWLSGWWCDVSEGCSVWVWIYSLHSCAESKLCISQTTWTPGMSPNQVTGY